jgi:signal transduction histidine kinase/ligand-binding sensor domain-containing protein/DNA-binding response OmpR family regulator
MKIAAPHKYLQQIAPSLRACEMALRCVVFIFFLFLFSPLVNSQEPSFHFAHIGVEDGLPSGQVNDVLIDDLGFVWFCTMEGLVKYDGQNFTNYTLIEGDDTSLSDFGATVAYQDSKGLIWVGTKKWLNCFDRKTNAFTRYYPKNDVSSNYNHITAIFEDSQGRYWVGTTTGLFEFNPHAESESFTVVTWAGRRGFDTITTIAECAGSIWTGTHHGLFKIETEYHSAHQFLPNQRNSTHKDTWRVHSIVAGRGGIYWIGAEDGLRTWTPERPDEFTLVPLPPPDLRASIKEVLEDRHGHLWLALNNDKGLLRMDISSGEFTRFTFSPANRLGIGSNRLYDLALDKPGNLCIATYTGVDHIFTGRRKFELYQQVPGTGHPENLAYNCFAAADGSFWFSTYDSRLFYTKEFSKKGVEVFNNQKPVHALIPPGVDKSEIISPIKLGNFQVLKFMQDTEGDIWLGSSGYGVFLIDSAKNIRHLRLSGTRSDFFTCRLLEEDMDDPRFLWIGTTEGLWKVNKTTFEKEVFLPEGSHFIVSGTQTPDGAIWLVVGDYNNGTLVRFDKQTSVFEKIQTAGTRPDNQSGMYVRQFAQTPAFLWLATPYGLGRIDLTSKSFSLLRKKDGLVEEQLMGVIADRDGNLWLKGLHHIIKYIPEQHFFWHFDIGEDMQEFNAAGATAMPDGRIVFNGNNGFYAFHPEDVRADSSKPVVVLTDFKVVNESMNLGPAPELVTRIPALPYSSNVVTFEFAALYHAGPGNCQYKHQLEGVDPVWVESDGVRANYSNLAPGNYIFKVIAANAGGLWLPEEEGLKVYLRILAPWYRRWWAYSLYALTGFGLLYGLRRYELKRQAAKAETKRLQELDEMKSRLYTNITHEFRTPLTVINGMAERLFDKVNYEAREGLKLIKRNGQQLLGLVNQMLDLAKLESRSLPVNLVQGDVILFLKYLQESFKSLAASKKVELSFSSSTDSYSMDYDVEKLRQIVSNLLSNAIKFVPEGGKVSVSAEESGKIFRIEVADDGPGIPADQLDKIFDRFYQVDDFATRSGEGTGIGLTLARELVKLLGGEIRVESRLGAGTKFTVLLPVSRNAAIEPVAPGQEVQAVPMSWSSATQSPSFGGSQSQNTRSQPILLIIEDNPDVIHYTCQVLQNDYKLLTAPNGKAGIEMARQTIPDIILSDVMMPEMDGYEVCRLLKSELQTSHIPIVMLTAKADFDSRMEGLEHGADAYLAKPFKEKELKIRLKKLLENRESLRQYYTSGEFLERSERSNEPELQLSARDQEFFKRMLEIVETHLGDPAFSAETMSHLLFVSYDTCLRKLKAITGMTVVEYIRHIRLHRAAQWLREDTGRTVADIAANAGYNSSAYFSRDFKKIMGYSPSEYRRAAKMNTN